MGFKFGIKMMYWKSLLTLAVLFTQNTRGDPTDFRIVGDSKTDHIDANLLRTLIGDYVDLDSEEAPETAQRDFPAVAPQIQEESLIQKEKTFNQVLSLMGQRKRPTGPGQFCDEFITGEDFYIYSPSYPNNYPANTTCKYQIYRRHPDFCGVILTVLRLDLAIWPRLADDLTNDISLASAKKEDGTCKGDSLIVDGVHYCGRYQRGQSALFTFPSSILTVEFSSGDTHGASGFLLLGRQVKSCRQPKSLGKALVSTVPCDARIESDNFTLKSPGYPRDYNHNVECHYFVSRGEGTCGIELVVEDFHLEDGSCMFDYVEVQGGRLCGELQPGFARYYEFEGPRIDIRFRSDESTKRGGFKISGQRVKCEEANQIQRPFIQSRPARADDLFASGSDVTDTLPESPTPLPTDFPDFPAGTLPINAQQASPLPPNNQSEIDISYILSVIGRRPITGLGERDEEYLPRDEYDTLSEEDFTELDPGLITEETTTNADQNIPGDPDFNPFTGTGLPPTFPTIPGRVPTTFPTTVDFPSTSSFPTFPTTTLTGESCDEAYPDVTFTVSSPGYPNAYSANLDCIYVVGRSSVDVCGLQVSLIDVDLPSIDTQTGQCNGDYLAVGDTKLCGTFQGRALTVNFNEQTLEMTFHSDATTAGRGFKMEVTQLTDCGTIPPDPGQCDTITQQSSFMLLSPGYPNSYPSNTDCTTTVIKSSPSVANLLLELVDFEVGSGFGCTGDYLEISGSGQRLCGQLTGQTRTYPFLGNSLTIRFHSGLQGNAGQRFRIRATQDTSGGMGGCGGVITSSTGFLQSPNYPLQYPSNSYCTFAVFKVSSDVCQLQLRILDFDIEDSSGCSKDFLQVGYQERLCGRRYNGEIRKYHFSDNRLDLYFRSDIYGSGRGFRAEITQLTCGHFKPSYPSYPPRPYYPVYRPAYRPYRPSKPWFKPTFWWKKNPFVRPHQLWQSYTAEDHHHSHDSSYHSGGHGTHQTYDSHSSHHQTTTVPYTPLTPFPTTPSPIFPTDLPTVTPTPFPTPFPTPPSELVAVPLNNTRAVFRPLSRPNTNIHSEKLTVLNQRQPKTEASIVTDDESGMCNKITDESTFQVRSPGYPGPYYTNMRCLFIVKRSDSTRCGIELLMDEFDVEETERCSVARLVIGDRSYCGFIPSGAHSVVPFPESGEILMEFVAGKYHSAAGFTMRGRQIGCPRNSTSSSSTSRVKFPTSQSKGASESFTSSRHGSHSPQRPVSDLTSLLAKDGDLVFPWAGARGRQPKRLDYEGWTPIF